MRNAHLTPKEIVLAANMLMVTKRSNEAVATYFAPDYVDHNLDTPGHNLAGMVSLMREMGFTEDNPNDRELTFVVDHAIAEGDMVMIHQHASEPGMPGLVFMELYRVRDGLIVEHWDVAQTVPENPVNTRVGMI